MRASARAAEPPPLADTPQGLAPGAAPLCCMLCRCILHRRRSIRFKAATKIVTRHTDNSQPGRDLDAFFRCRAQHDRQAVQQSVWQGRKRTERAPGVVVLPVVGVVVGEGAALQPVPACFTQVERLAAGALVPACDHRASLQRTCQLTSGQPAATAAKAGPADRLTSGAPPVSMVARVVIASSFQHA